jgi:hypothetical protein
MSCGWPSDERGNIEVARKNPGFDTKPGFLLFLLAVPLPQSLRGCGFSRRCMWQFTQLTVNWT